MAKSQTQIELDAARVVAKQARDAVKVLKDKLTAEIAEKKQNGAQSAVEKAQAKVEKLAARALKAETEKAAKLAKLKAKQEKIALALAKIEAASLAPKQVKRSNRKASAVTVLVENGQAVSA